MLRRAFVLGVLAAFVLSASAHASYLEVGGQRAQVLRPPVPNGHLVLYIHGASGSADAISEGPVVPLTHALLARGYTVAASDAHGPQNWGNPASVADYVHLAHRLHFKRINILAQSMGGLDGVQLIDRLHPEAFAGIFPVCNIDSLGPSLAPNWRELIEGAWGGWAPARMSPVKASDVAGLPVMLWASLEDKMVPKAQNADVCAAWMRNRGAKVTELTTEGEHGDPSNFQPRQLAQFFAAA